MRWSHHQWRKRLYPTPATMHIFSPITFTPSRWAPNHAALGIPQYPQPLSRPPIVNAGEQGRALLRLCCFLMAFLPRRQIRSAGVAALPGENCRRVGRWPVSSLLPSTTAYDFRYKPSVRTRGRPGLALHAKARAWRKIHDCGSQRTDKEGLRPWPRFAEGISRRFRSHDGPQRRGTFDQSSSC